MRPKATPWPDSPSLILPERWLVWLPVGACFVGGMLMMAWMLMATKVPVSKRIPGTDHAPGAEEGVGANPVLAGKLLKGGEVASDLGGAWSGFLGPERTSQLAAVARTQPRPDGSAHPAPTAALARSWESGGPRELWGTELGEGYAGAAVLNGCVYVMDYDREKKQDAVRCLSLATGREIWRFVYPVAVKRNHGMTRTVPAVTEHCIVAMGPKCHVSCLNAQTGELQWGIDLVRQYGTTVPPWYAGQCPLVDNGAVILAPGGKEALLMAVDLQSGKVLWQTPNPRGWKMTHSSVMPMLFGGERMYVYCASGGVVGVSAKDGHLLWDTADWKISIATVPSPTVLEDGRIFLSGGYNAGSLMLQLKAEGGKFTTVTAFKLDAEVFGATQQTPVLFRDHLYGVRADGQFVCLGLDGKVVWTSGPGQSFGLGSFLLADGLFYILNDTGALGLVEASAEKFTLLSQAQVLKGHESWGPMALAGTRLLARDLTRMVCLEVGK